MPINQIKKIQESNSVIFGKRSYTLNNGVFKSTQMNLTSTQKQTQSTFGFKWKQEDTFNSPASLSRMKNWLLDRYEDPSKWLNKLSVEKPVVLDAGCGAGMSGFEYFGSVSQKIDYFGIDVSEAVDVAKKRTVEKGFNHALFMQESIANLPFTEPMFDIVFSEGVLHHTDNTQNTFNHLCQFLKDDGLFMFYVYRKKAPLREFTDDHIREQLQPLTAEQGWEELKSLTKLGIELGKLDIEINVPENIKTLDIPAGKINLQRLFYWYFCKAFYDPNLTFDEMHHINFDWYAPKNAHRHTVEEIKQWCKNNKLEIESIKEELSGITCIARKVEAMEAC